MANRQRVLSAAMWVTAGMSAVALMVMAGRLVVAAPAPGMPAYVPQLAELPAMAPANADTWNSISWRQRGGGGMRSADWQRFARLHSTDANGNCDWSRREATPVPAARGPMPSAEQTDRHVPNAADATADLLKRLVVRAFFGPSHVLVSLTATPDDEYMLVGPDAWARYVAGMKNANGRDGLPDDPTRFSGQMVNDLQRAGLPLRVLSISRSGWTVAYRFRGCTFEIALPPLSTPGSDTDPELAGELADVLHGSRD